MDRFLFLTFDGLSRGAVYAAFALALVLIWRAARIVNFAQGAMRLPGVAACAGMECRKTSVSNSRKRRRIALSGLLCE